MASLTSRIMESYVATPRLDPRPLSPRPVRMRSDDCRAHNARRPINKLPPTVMCKIFAACALLGAHDRNWTWTTVTHVCFYWRKCALAHTPLWGNIDFTHEKLTKITLKRAKATPLYVRGTVETHNVTPLYDVLSSSGNIREIDLTATLHGFQALQKALIKPHLVLKSLTLVIVGRRNHGEIVHQSSKHGPSFPHLTYLELHRCPFAFVSHRYPELTHLSLYSLPPSERPEFNDFLGTLSRYPLLQRLTLVDAFAHPITPGSFSDNAKCIRLPLLKSIILEGPLVEISQLLDHLILPHTVRITCVITKLNGPNDDQISSVKKLAKALTFHLNNFTANSPSRSSPAPSLHKLVLSSSEESFRYLNAQCRPNALFRQQLRLRGYYTHSGWESAALDLVFYPDSHCHDDKVYVNWLSLIWRALPLHNLHTLALQNVDVITQKVWSKLLRPLERLQVLECNGQPPSGLAWALLLNAMEPEGEDMNDSVLCDGASPYLPLPGIPHKSTLLIPHLCDILLYDVDCLAGGYMLKPGTYVNLHTDLDDSRFLDVITTAFRQRQTIQATLRCLRLYQCKYVSKRTLKELRRCVSTLYWDHKGALDEDEYPGSVLDFDARSVRSEGERMMASTTTLSQYFGPTFSVKSSTGSVSSGSSSGGGLPARYRKICVGADQPECRYFNRLFALQDQNW